MNKHKICQVLKQFNPRYVTNIVTHVIVHLICAKEMKFNIRKT